MSEASSEASVVEGLLLRLIDDGIIGPDSSAEEVRTVFDNELNHYQVSYQLSIDADVTNRFFGPLLEPSPEILGERKQAIVDFARSYFPHSSSLDAVLEAFAAVPRENFMMAALRGEAYTDRPCPIGYGQTISQPSVVLEMLLHLDVQPGDKVLEIGTGLGYNAALLSRLGKHGHVYSIEILKELAESASRRLASFGATNVAVLKRDGSVGLPEEVPFNRIILSAALDYESKAIGALLGQLSQNGTMIAPVRGMVKGLDDACLMIAWKKEADGVRSYFVPKRSADNMSVDDTDNSPGKPAGGCELVPFEFAGQKAPPTARIYWFVDLQGLHGVKPSSDGQNFWERVAAMQRFAAAQFNPLL